MLYTMVTTGQFRSNVEVGHHDHTRLPAAGTWNPNTHGPGYSKRHRSERGAAGDGQCRTVKDRLGAKGAESDPVVPTAVTIG